jgi:hypothetical protein
MANNPQSIQQNAVHVYNPDALYVTPFEGDARGTTTYKLGEVIRDTTTISQDDPTEDKIENEFGSAPILSNTKLGSYTFSAEVADMQSTLLEKLCGYIKGQAGDRTYAPSTYTPIYAEIVLAFKISDNKYVAAVMPKVQLNSKVTMDSLSTSMGRITLAGTGLNLSINDGDRQIETPFYIDSSWTINEL